MKMLRNLLLALPLLAASGVALADHDHGRDDHGRGHDRRDHYDRGHDRDRHDGRRDDWRRDDRRYGYERHGRDWHHWERGRRYGGPYYVVHDYRSYRLRPPPYGYRWVRADNSDYLLVAIATGIILDYAIH